MKQNLFLFVSLMLIAFVIVSCKIGFDTQVYRFIPSIDSDIYSENEIRKKIVESDVKSIILRNDSILEYWKRYGGIGSSMIIKYALIDNELIVYPTDVEGYNVPDISDMHFLYSRDSLINIKTNEKFYNQKYLDKKKMKNLDSLKSYMFHNLF